MSQLSFAVVDARPEVYAAVPTIGFRLRVGEDSDRRVHAMVLRCQIRIDPEQRAYDDATKQRLGELFGEPSRWRDTVRSFVWAIRSVSVPGFVGSTEVDLPIECSYDLEVGFGKYFHALRDGEVPLTFLFSGTVFFRGQDGISVEQIPWDREASFRLPVATWRDLVDAFWPASGWLRLSRDTIDALQAYKQQRAIPTWDLAVLAALDEVALTGARDQSGSGARP